MNKIHFLVWMLSWIKSYLEDRILNVVVRSSILLERKIECGVPQGSILGPLIFLKQILKTEEFITNCIHIAYAGDTQMFFKSYTVDGLFAIMGTTLAQLSSYL